MGGFPRAGSGGTPGGAAGGGLSGTYPNPAVKAAAADVLVGTASGDLSAGIVVGTTPGGDLSNTWAAPRTPTRQAQSADKATFSRSSSAYGDVTGLAVTATLGASGLALVILSVQDFVSDAISGVGYLSFKVDAGASSDVDALQFDDQTLGVTDINGVARQTLISGLSAGAHTFQAQLRSTDATQYTVINARITVIPL